MLEAWTEGVADWEPSSWTLDVGTSAWRQLTDRARWSVGVVARRRLADGALGW